VCIGPARASESYLKPETIVQAALGTGCDAIHPGYGFLSENPRLAALARDEGIRFVGPPPEVIELAGDKLRARQRAAESGLPLVPGGEVETLDAARRFAADAGYPVLLKAAGGGGGRGIKLARDADELSALFPVAVAEAESAFGDPRLYVERFVAAARHVEVQVAADAHGSVVHLGERDCSVQRRYQKVIEEAPAPALTDAQRAQGWPIIGEGGSWGLGTGVDVEAARPWMAPGRWGWVGGTGTTAHVDPVRGTVAVLLTQRALTGPEDGWEEFWQAVADAATGT